MNNLNQFKKLLSKRNQIVILSHRSPDGDSVGSSLAFMHWMEKMNQKVQVITPDPAPSFLGFLSGFDTIINGINEAEQVEECISNADILVALDFNDLNRLGPIEEHVKSNEKAFILNIDHHQEPVDFADLQISDTTASSTAQMVFEFMSEMGNKEMIDKELGECIYTGILTDTGSFRFSSTSSKTHDATSFLLNQGVEPSSIHEKIYDNFSIDRLKLIGYALNQRFNYYPKYRTGIIYLDEADLKKFNFKKGDTEGLVNYPLSIQNIKMAILIMQKDGKVKMSFRSKGDFHVNELAKKYFSGGGHYNAAGGISELSVSETLTKIEKLLPEYESELLN